MFKEKYVLFKNNLECLDNMHRCMKVIDAKGKIDWFTTMCHGFPAQISYFQISNFKLKFNCVVVVHNDQLIGLVNLSNEFKC